MSLLFFPVPPAISPATARPVIRRPAGPGPRARPPLASDRSARPGGALRPSPDPAPVGVGGNADTTAGDGYYELDAIVGRTPYTHDFYRLLGDVTGDGGVDNKDLTAIATELTLPAPTG